MGEGNKEVSISNKPLESTSSVNNTSLVSSLMSRIQTNTKFAIEIFYGTRHFGMWKCEAKDVLIQQGLDLTLEEEKSDNIGDVDWRYINRVACGTIRSFLGREQKCLFT